MFNFDGDNDFRLTNEESKKGLKQVAMGGLYLLLGIVVLVTGAHAIMLVMSQAPEAVTNKGGLVTAVLNVIRIAFPVTMELAAVVAGLGFISAKWRKGQTRMAWGIEIAWIIFAASNMITFFRIERGLPLESWQTGWINYGLPLTCLAAGILAYYLTRNDPDLKRKNEETAADEKIKMIQFAARRDVATSPQREAIERQRAWVDFVKDLRSKGYTDLQIRYMLQDTPELLIDGNKNGNMDLLEGEHKQLPEPNKNGRVIQAAQSPTPLPTEVRERVRSANPAHESNGRSSDDAAPYQSGNNRPKRPLGDDADHFR